MAGAVFGDAGALLLWQGQHLVCSVTFVLFRGKRSIGDRWVESRSAKRCYFQKEMRLQTAASKLGKPAGAR